MATNADLRKRQMRKLKQAPACSECGQRETAADLLDTKLYWNALSTGARQFAVVEGPEQLLITTDDNRTGRIAFIKGGINTTRLEKAMDIAGLSRPGGTLVEVGAGFGGHAIAAVNRELFSKAIAVEPSPSAFRLLQANVALNGVTEQITCSPMALTQEGQLDLQLSTSAKSTMGSRTALPGSAPESLTSIPATTLDALAPTLNSSTDLVVIDVFGYEGAVLEGASSTIETGVAFMFTFSPQQTARYGCFGGIQSLLAQYGGWYDLSASEPERQSGGYLSDMYRSAVEADASAKIEILVTKN